MTTGSQSGRSRLIEGVRAAGVGVVCVETFLGVIPPPGPFDRHQTAYFFGNHDTSMPSTS